MNAKYILSLIDDEIKTVKVSFREGQRSYTYMTKDVYEVGDMVVVPVGIGDSEVYKTGVIEQVDEIPDVENSSSISYKFVVCKVNFDSYNQLNAEADKAESKLKEHIRAKHRAQALESLGLTDFKLLD